MGKDDDLTVNSVQEGPNSEDLEIRAAVSELSRLIVSECERLAHKLLHAREHTDHRTEPQRLELALVQLRIMRGVNEVKHDLTGVVAAARRAGATWEQIGTTCGITKQAAYDRWRGPVKTFEQAAAWAQEHAKLPVDPLDQYDTTFVTDGRPPQGRRAASPDDRR